MNMIDNSIARVMGAFYLSLEELSKGCITLGAKTYTSSDIIAMESVMYEYTFVVQERVPTLPVHSITSISHWCLCCARSSCNSLVAMFTTMLKFSTLIVHKSTEIG